MDRRIEDYAVIGDTQSAALVSREGSIDWLCWPRFDSEACFARLLGDQHHGRFLVTPDVDVLATRRRYRPDTLVLETEYDTACGTVRVTDFMSIRHRRPDLVRLVEGRCGRVPMRLELSPRFGYGQLLPWVRCESGAWLFVVGPDALRFDAPVTFAGKATLHGRFDVRAGEKVPLTLEWFRSHEPPPPPLDADEDLARTTQWWRDWSAQADVDGPWRDEIVQSLRVIKALTYAPTGGIIAAVTTSLPEQPGGTRNWDYRYCWLRDATYALYALLLSGYREEACAWRDWLVRAAAGDPNQLQIMYGPAGERRLQEWEASWLPGFGGARPVRIGNAASDQLQLDVYGEVLETLHMARVLGAEPQADAWALEMKLLESVAQRWRQPDHGIWEVRGPRQRFTHSQVMCWVAVDRAIKTAHRFGLHAPLSRWHRLRTAIRDDVLREGFDPGLGSFVQTYGGRAVDASLLALPLVGFLKADDPRIAGTVRRIERELMEDGFVHRYRTEHVDDGLPPGEGAFLACTLWLADVYVLQGRHDEAQTLFERVLAVRNDVGLLAEEYDPRTHRQLGNFPQAFSHVAVVNTALNLTRSGGPARHREAEGAGANGAIAVP